MTNLTEKKKKAVLGTGCSMVLFGCLGIISIGFIINWVKSSQNLCNLISPQNCLNIYRVGGYIEVGQSLAITDDGRFLAISSLTNLMILDTESGKVIANAETGINGSSFTYPINVAISPNGKYAAAITNTSGVFILSAEDQDLQFIESVSPTIGIPYRPIAFSRDNKHLLFSQYNWQEDNIYVVRYDLEKKTASIFMDSYDLLTLSPDGETIVLQRGSTIELWHYSDSPVLLREIPIKSTEQVNAAISPDGRMIALVGYFPDSNNAPTLQLIDIKTMKLSSDIRTGSNLYQPSFSPDGQYLMRHGCRADLLTINADGSLSDLWIEPELLDPIANTLHATSGSPTCTSNIVMDPNGKFMYYGSSGLIGRFSIPEFMPLQ
jgi:WD40 repeat protein